MRQIVKNVQENSIADVYGIKAGDEIVSINGEKVLDYIDYAFFLGEEHLNILLRSPESEERTVCIQKEDWEDLGISFEKEIGKPALCQNRCIFCFVDQLPHKMRRTLYVKDDDWRHSFLMGNYVTLTNLSEEDAERIIRRKTSPLYVSVHATDNDIRAEMLRNPKAAALMPMLRRLAKNGIRMHAQIVVCPGINDGNVLEKSVRDLFGLYPNIASVAVVPVGLTRYRDALYPVRPVDPKDAIKILDMIHTMQQDFFRLEETRFVYGADELYIRAGKPLPAFEEYEDFSQIENGVGLLAKFEDEIEQGIADVVSLKYKTISIASGVDAAPFMKKIAKRLEHIYNITIYVYSIKNFFFGPQVTVAGLLTGRDITSQLMGKKLGEKLFLSGNIFREFTDVTLDDMTIKEISGQLGVSCEASPSDGYEWLSVMAKEIV